MKRAEDIQALEAVIETEGFPLDHKEKKRFTELRERALLKKINSMNPPSPINAPGSGQNEDKDGQAKIFISNLDKDANTMPVDGNDRYKNAANHSDDNIMAPSYAQSPELKSQAET